MKRIPVGLILGTDTGDKMRVVRVMAGQDAHDRASACDLEQWSARSVADAVAHARAILNAASTYVPVRRQDLVDLLASYDELLSLAAIISCEGGGEDCPREWHTEDVHRGLRPAVEARLRRLAQGKRGRST